MADLARYDGSKPEPPYPTPQADAMQRRSERELIAEMLAALKSSREVVEEHAHELLRSFCTIKNGEPDRGSMDDNERQIVAELESVLAEIDAAVANAQP